MPNMQMGCGVVDTKERLQIWIFRHVNAKSEGCEHDRKRCRGREDAFLDTGVLGLGVCFRACASWRGGQVTTVPLLTNLFVPSSLCLLGAMGYELLFVIEGRKPFERRKEKSISTEAPAGQQLVFWGGLLGMVGVPVFTAFTKCPAWTGMMLVLGLLGLITSLLHEPGDDRYSLKGALKRVEVPDALFFLGVLFAVGALERVGLLKDFAEQLSQLLPDDSLVAIFLGFASAVVDNVPLVAATQGMYDLSAHPANDGLWNLITYCAATGRGAQK